MNIGETLAVLQSAGTTSVVREDLKSTVNAGASSEESSFRSLGLIPSGPGALLGFKSFKSFFTPASVMLMELRVGESGGVKERGRFVPQSYQQNK